MLIRITCVFVVDNIFIAGTPGNLSFLDEAAEIGSKVARHLSDIDAADMAKAGRGLSHADELAGVAKAGRSAAEMRDTIFDQTRSNIGWGAFFFGGRESKG